MKPYIICLLVFICVFSALHLKGSKPKQENIDLIYSALGKYASHFNSPSYGILIDYNRPFFKKRLWVIDLKTKEVMLSSRVSHAFKSGVLWPKKTSNEPGSRKSSVGVFKTLNAYESSFGKGIYKIGMRLKGLEPGINDNVLGRNIVFHSSYGIWSSGCFMTPPKTNKEIIDYAKGGNIVLVIKKK